MPCDRKTESGARTLRSSASSEFRGVTGGWGTSAYTDLGLKRLRFGQRVLTTQKKSKLCEAMNVTTEGAVVIIPQCVCMYQISMNPCFKLTVCVYRASLVAQTVKRLSAMQETGVRSLG